MTTKKKPTQQMFVEEDDTTQKAPTEASEQDDTPPLTPGANHLQLPSNGVLGYPETVEYRDILVKDEETLSMATPETYAKTLNGVLKGILNNCSFFEDMCIHDRDYALVWLWANNYEAVKNVDIKCSTCSHEENHEVDLTALDVESINPKIRNPMEIPIGEKGKGKSVKVRLSTVGDELVVENYMAKEENKAKRNFEHLMMVASIDVGVKISFDKKVDWVGENIRSKDMAYIKKFHQYFKYGVASTIEHTCSKCGEVTKGSLPFSASDVLWPTVDVDLEDIL